MISNQVDSLGFASHYPEKSGRFLQRILDYHRIAQIEAYELLIYCETSTCKMKSAGNSCALAMKGIKDGNSLFGGNSHQFDATSL